MKIYVDHEKKCHVTNDGTMTEKEDAFFDGKCQTFIEGYCYDDSKDYVAIYPWIDSSLLAASQRQYEVMLSDMDNAYREGVESA